MSDFECILAPNIFLHFFPLRSKSQLVFNILATKMFLHFLPSRSKSQLVFNICRSGISRRILKWVPMRGSFGSYIYLLLMPNYYYEKELPEKHSNLKLSNVTHLFDGKDIVIEILQKDNNLRNRCRLEKVSDSACRFLIFSTGI